MAEVGRADVDVIKSQFYYANRDALLEKGGLRSKTDFTDPKLNALLEATASETDPAKRNELAAPAQGYLLDMA